MRLPEEEPHRRGVHALIAQIARREKIPETLRHLRAAHVEELAVQPEARERLPGRRFRLRDLVFVMRKDQIDAARVDVERFGAAALPDLLERHVGALEVPSGPTTPERRVPGRAQLLVRRLGLLPQRKIARVVLRVLVARDPRADLELSRVESRQPPVGRELGDGEIDRAVVARSEEHTSELQSQSNLVCRLLLEKKNKQRKTTA